MEECVSEYSADKEEKEREIDIPAQKEMYELLLKYMEKTERLEKQIEKLTKNNINKKDPKIDIKNFLNENYGEDPIFNYSMLKIKKEDYNSICSLSYLDGIKSIFKNIFNTENNLTLSIRKVENKKNVIYIKKDNWEIMTYNDIENFILNISKKLMKFLVDWQNQNKDKLLLEKYADLYTDNLQKILGTNFNSHKHLVKIKSLLYNTLATTYR